TVQASISAAVLHSEKAAEYQASATAKLPASACTTQPVCPVLQRTPGGGCCPEGQPWNGSSCGEKIIQTCPAGSSGTPPDQCFCPDGSKPTGTPPKCKTIEICPRGSKPVVGGGCVCPDGQFAIGKPPKCPPPLVPCPP